MRYKKKVSMKNVCKFDCLILDLNLIEASLSKLNIVIYHKKIYRKTRPE